MLPLESILSLRPRQTPIARQAGSIDSTRENNASACGRRPEHDRGFEHASRVEQAQAVVGENLSESKSESDGI